MEDTKYYTPEIEEFHFGFEFEEDFKNPNWNKLSKPAIDVWEYIKLKLDTSHSISRIIGKIKINKVRVKYLDKEDIESLGFVHIGRSLLKDNIGVKFVCKSNKNYFIHLSYTKFSDRVVLRIETSVKEDSERTLVCHSIRCNNLSEFKKLLKKQLNVIK